MKQRCSDQPISFFKRLMIPQPKRDKFSGLSRKAKRRKLAREDDEELGDSRTTAASIRSAKKSLRPTKMGEPEAPRFIRVKDKRKNPTRPSKTKVSKGVGFIQEVGGKRQTASLREGARAKKGDAIAGVKKEAKRKNR
jgi:ATP-dependent RNA helicase DDX27